MVSVSLSGLNYTEYVRAILVTQSINRGSRIARLNR